MLLVMVPVGMVLGLVVVFNLGDKDKLVRGVESEGYLAEGYESVAVIEIKHRNEVGVHGGDRSSQANNTAIEVIKSRGVLGKVVESLDLITKWNLDKESCIQVLRKIVFAENVRGTDLIRILARHPNPEDARDVAAEVSRAYKEYRAEVAGRDSEKLINELRKAVREQEDRVEEKRLIVSRIARRKAPNGGDETVDLHEYVDAKRELETELALLEAMKLKLLSLEIEDTILADSIVVHDDPVISDEPVSAEALEANYVTVPKDMRRDVFVGMGVGALVSPFFALPLMAFFIGRRRGV